MRKMMQHGSKRRTKMLLAAVWAAASVSHLARGATYTWDGGSTVSNNWSTGDNWLNAADDNAVPPAEADVVFGASTNSAILDLSTTIGSMTFNTGSSYTLGVAGGSSLTINTGITTAGASGLTYAVNPSIVFGSALTFNVAANNMLALAAAATDEDKTYGLTKSGSGTLVMSGLNTYSGVTTIGSGILEVSSLADGGGSSGIGNSGSTSSNLVLNGGTLRYTGSATSTNRLFTVNSNGGTLDSSGSGAVNFTNSNSITRSGTAFLTLTGTNEGDNTLAARVVDGTKTTVVKSGSGKWILGNPNNSYTGDTIINGGTLEVSSIADAGASGIGSNNGLTLNGGALRYTGTGAMTGRLPTIGTSGAILDASGSGSLNFSGSSPAVISGTGIRTLTLTGTSPAANTIGFSITNDSSANPTSLVKAGTGQWVLSRTSNNPYIGTTTVNDGTLSLASSSGTNNPISSSSKITVGSSGILNVTNVKTSGGFRLGSNQTLAGTGNVYGAVTSVNIGSKVMPGDTDMPGTLTINSNFSLTTGVLAIESDAGTFSVLSVAGAVTLGGNLQLKASYRPSVSLPIKIINKTDSASNTISTTFAGLANNAYFQATSGTYVGDWYKISYFGGDGNDVVISRQTVPEPSTLALLCLSAGVLLNRRRKKVSGPLRILAQLAEV